MPRFLIILLFTIFAAFQSKAFDNERAFISAVQDTAGYVDSWGSDTLHILSDEFIIMTGHLNEWVANFSEFQQQQKGITHVGLHEGGLEGNIQDYPKIELDPNAALIALLPTDLPLHERKYYAIIRNKDLVKKFENMRPGRDHSIFIYSQPFNYWFGLDRLNSNTKLSKLKNSVIRNAPKTFGKVKATKLNIRSFDTTEIVAQAKNGRLVPIYGKTGNFAIIGENRITAKNYLTEFPAFLMWGTLQSKLSALYEESDKLQSSRLREIFLDLDETTRENSATPEDLRLYKALSSSDNFEINQSMFLNMSKILLKDGVCTVNDFNEAGGWWKSTTKMGEIYFTYCGGMNLSNKVYIDLASEKYFKD